MLKLSINILCWNNWNVLHNTLHNLAEDLKDIQGEVIIIDNGSIDGCEKVATIANKENIGISRAKNQGLDLCKGEYVLMLDGDVLYMPGSARCLIEWLEHNPREFAIGFYPNKFTNQKNTDSQKHHEEVCVSLCDIISSPAACIYYGMHRKEMFDLGIRCSEDGPFALPGYGWEDRDFFFQMREAGIAQWIAKPNTPTGRYFHDINSSIKQMGSEEYIRTSKIRATYFKDKWINSSIRI